MSKFLDKLGDALYKEPTRWVVDHEKEGYISEVSIERSTKNISSHQLKINLKRPVREGNIISHMNLIDVEGNLWGTVELSAGVVTIRLYINPDDGGPLTEGPVKVVTVDDEENIYAKDRIQIRKEKG